MRKKLMITGVIVILVIAGFAGWFFTRPSAQEGNLTLYGNVDIRQVSLAFKGNDRIVQMYVEEGNPVKAGQVLATLDTHDLTLQIRQAKAQVAAMEANADLAGQQHTRVQGVTQDTGGRAVSRQELDSASAGLRSAKAQLELARAQLALLEYHLSQAQLISPVNAVVRARLLEPGDMASSERPVYTLAISDPKWVRAYVTGAQLGWVKPGQQAVVITDSHPEQKIAGEVGYISSVAEFTPKNVQTPELRTSLVYEIRILVKDPDNRLRLGMPATVYIETGNK